MSHWLDRESRIAAQSPQAVCPECVRIGLQIAPWTIPIYEILCQSHQLANLKPTPAQLPADRQTTVANRPSDSFNLTHRYCEK